MTATFQPNPAVTDDPMRRALQLAAQGVAAHSGENVFEQLVRNIALALGVNYAFVGVLDRSRSQTMNVIAMYRDGDFTDPFTYELPGTPCERVVGNGYRYYPDKVQVEFNDGHARLLRVEGYAGISLFGSRGQVLGIMTVMNREPLVDSELTENLLKIFSVRAALELERIQATRDAKEKSEQYRAIFDASVDGLLLFDPNGRVVEANPAFKRMHGYDVDHDFFHKDPFEFIPAESHGVYHEFMRTVMEKGELQTEGMGQRTDGVKFWVDIHGVRMDYQGQPHLLAIARDITQQKLAEQQLKDREEQYRVMFDATSDGMALWNSEGELVDVNEACCGLHGMTREQLLKADLTEFVPPESMPILKNLLATVRRGRSYQDEAIATHKDGRVFYLDIRGEPATFQGEPHVLLILRDITDSKKQQEELRKSEDRFRITAEAALDCIVSMDESGHVIDFNPAAERVFGYRRADAVGKPLAELLIPLEHRERHAQGMKHYLATGEGPILGKRMETMAMRADGTTIPVELAIDAAQGAEGKIFIGYIRDITDRKEAEVERSRLEAQLRQAQKMEAIGHLTGGIAHDFNNILTGIMGYIVMAQEWEAKNPDEKLHRYLDRVNNSGVRARDLIQQMLTFSRGQRGEPRPLQLGPLIKEEVKLLESMLPSSVEIRLNIEDGLPSVMADPVHVEQVLMNLCINARDAMGGSGLLEIGLRQVECLNPCTCSSCRKSAAGHFIELSVADRGPGISRDVIDRIFEPFYTTKEVGKGSGMGLSTVHGIVHECGGHIRVDSEVGKGSRFCVMVPPLEVCDIHGAGAGQASAESASARGLVGSVLLVDDDIDVRDYMVDRLCDWGLKVDACANGAEALSRVGEDKSAHDLYLLDFTMPGMTGIELAKAIRKVHPEAKVILYTGFAEAMSQEELDEAGVITVVRKPVDVDALHTLIDETLSKAD